MFTVRFESAMLAGTRRNQEATVGAKKILIPLIVVLLVLFLGLPLLLRLLFPEPRLRAMVLPRVEAALERPVELAGISLGFKLSGLTLELENLVLGADPTNQGLKTLSLPKLRANLAWGPLLRRRIEVRSLRVEDARIELGPAAAVEKVDGDAAPSGGGRSAAFAVAAPDLRLSNTAIHLDQAEGGELILNLPAMRFASEMHPDGALELSGELMLDGIEGGLPGGLTAGGKVRLDFDLSLDDENLRLSRCEGDISGLTLGLPSTAGGVPLEIRGERVELELSLESPLAAFAGETQDLNAPTAKADLALSAFRMSRSGPAPLSLVLPAAGAELTLSAGQWSAEFAPLILESEQLSAPLALEACRLSGSLTAMVIETLRLSAGASSLSAQGRLDGPPEAPRMDLQLQSPLLDLADFLPPKAEVGTENGADARPETASPPAALPPGRIVFTVDRLITRQAEVTGLRGRVEVSEQALELKDLNGALLGGQLAGAFSATPGETGTLDCRGDFDIRGSRAGDLLAAFTPIKQGLEGILGGDLNFNFTLPPGGKPEGLDLSADLDLQQGALVNLPLLSAVARVAGLPERERYALGNLRQTVTVRKDRVHARDLRLPFEDGWLEMAGSAGLAGDLDFSGQWELGPQTLARLGGGSALGFLKNAEGTVTLDLRVGGTVKRPVVTLDTKALQNRLKEEARRKLEDEGEELLRKGLDSLRDRFK